MPPLKQAALVCALALLVNAFVGYRIQAENLRYLFQLNIQNVTDEFVTEGQNLGTVAPPRSFRFSAGVNF